jgi:hypothetical protein
MCIWEDISHNALYSLDTSSGEFVAGTKLRGVPGYAALMCVSRDNSKLFVPLASGQCIQVISLADLATSDILHVPFAPQCLAMAAGDVIYALAGGSIYAIDSATGHILSSGPFEGTLIKSDSTGTRLFSMRLGISGGGSQIDEFAIVNGQAPQFVRGYISSGSANDKDFEVDTTRNTLYTTAGGVYGIAVLDMTTMAYSFWPYDAPYGVGVAHVPDGPFVYGTSGGYYDARIVRFSKETGEKDAFFDLSAAYGNASILDRSIQVTPNGVMFYGRESGRMGLVGVGTLGTPPAIADTIDAGPDRILGADEILRLPQAQWRRVSGLGEVTFTNVAGTIQANFQFPCDYVLEGSIGATRLQRDLLRVTVPPVKKAYVAIGAVAAYKAPKSAADLSSNGVAWTDPAFDDSDWSRGAGGFGYERRASGAFDAEITTSVSAAMYNETPSLLLRIPFAFQAESNRIASMELRIKSDDGFIAYLNGLEVARFNAGTSTPAWNTTAPADTPDSQALTLRTVDLTAYASKVITGTNILAIHALNDAANNDAMLVSPELRIAVFETPFTVWGYQFPGFSGLAASALADPDADGRPNFAEFALGTDPTVASGASGTQPPKLQIVNTPDGQRLQVVYSRRKNAAEEGLAYRLLFSPDLTDGSWRYGGTVRYPTKVISVQPILNDTFELVTEQLDVAAPVNFTFARLDVQWTAP